MSTIVFCALYDITIDDIKGEGIELPFGIRITTDNEFKQKLIWEMLEPSIGGIEFDYLFKAPILYKIIDIDANEKNKDDLLGDFLGYCQLIQFDLWQIKDNAVNIQMGYLFYPFKMQSMLVSTYTAMDIEKAFVHSNLLSTMFTHFKGGREPVYFNAEEIKSLLIYDEGRSAERLTKHEASKTLLHASQQKMTLASIFIQLARTNHDLALKVTLSCTALECLFTTDNKELSHKTAERTALLIGTNKDDRKNVYEKVKDIYSVRSQVLHGTAISRKMYNKIEVISTYCDDILRRVIRTIDNTPELDVFYRNSSTKGNSHTNEKNFSLYNYFLDKLLD